MVTAVTVTSPGVDLYCFATIKSPLDAKGLVNSFVVVVLNTLP
jgi:hypothetical protein